LVTTFKATFWNAHLVDNDRGVEASVLGDGEAGLLQGVLDDFDALPLVLVDRLQRVQHRQAPVSTLRIN
jgi:hypothetical protein